MYSIYSDLRLWTAPMLTYFCTKCSKVGKVCAFFSFRRHLWIFAICLHITLRNFIDYVIRCECYATRAKKKPTNKWTSQMCKINVIGTWRISIWQFWFIFVVLRICRRFFFADGVVDNEFTSAAICWQFVEQDEKFCANQINRKLCFKGFNVVLFCSISFGQKTFAQENAFPMQNLANFSKFQWFFFLSLALNS